MNTVRREIKVKRVSSCKRSRDIQRSHLTPAKKRGSAADEQLLGSQVEEVTVQQEQLQVMTVDEYCNDSEDLFGDYDSILGDGSFVSKLEDVERNVEEENPVCARRGDTASEQPVSVTQHSLSSESDFTALKAMGRDGLKQSHSSGDAGILNGLRDGLFEDLPSSQLQFQEVTRKAEQDRKGTNAFSEGGNPPAPVTKTPLQIFPAPEAAKGRPAADPSPLTRRSVVDHLKKAMVENASASSPVISRTTVQRRAIVTEEIGIAVKTMESVSMEIDLGPFFGLPSKVRDLIFKLRGIEDLYDWQKTCLTLDSVQQRKNLIYSLPTSGGKTLVAEVLILKELLCRRMDALFILPYISLVQEKVRGLAGLGLELGFLLEEYAGSKGRFPPVKRRTKKSLYIATIEKGHSLINSLVEAGRLDNLGLLVVDELHMLGEESRGAVLEMTLAKVLYASPSTQIIGMSATLSNIGDLQTFLKADHFSNDFRPVKLVEYVKLSESIYEVHPKEEECFRFSRLANFKYSSSMQKVDPDHIIALVTEVIPKHSCLVFCPSKKNCENVATMICKYLKKDFLLHWKAEKGVLLQELQTSGHGSLCPVLQRTVPFGLAYHHSGLTSEERRLVEEAYSAGVLCLLTCTSTLAAGINLPARRVILRSPYVATEFLKRSQYKQMVGRAGRAGIDTMGESILILQEKDKLMAKELVSSPMESCFSSLMHDNGRGLLSLILSLVGLNIATTLEQLVAFMTGTLLSTQKAQTCSEKSLEDITQESVGFLRQKGLLSLSAECEDTAALHVTKLGRATYKGSIHLTYCEALYRDLSKGLEGLLLNSYLHLVYLVTPYDMVSQCKPDWMVFYRQFSKLSAAEQRMAAALGVPESFVARRAAGQSVKKPADAAVVNRLYLALVLFSLLKETDLWAVAERFQLTRGYVQSLLGSASAHCSCVLHFTEELEEFWPYKALLTELTRRLTYCVQAELIPLMEVAGVQEVRAKQLYAAGYKTLSHLASANPDLLITAVQNLSKRQANQIVASAKMLLIEKAEALQEEVNDLLTTPPDLPS